MHFEKAPPTVIFSGNPIRYQIHLDDGGGGGGQIGAPTVVVLDFSDIDNTEDHAITVAFLGTERTFTLKTTPSDAYHLPATTTEEAVATWAGRVYAQLQRNGLLMKAYQLAIDDTGLKISLTAYEVDPALDMSVVTNTITGLSMQTTPASPLTLTYDGVAIMVMDKDGFLLGEDVKPINTTNLIDFEISEYLNAQFANLTPPRFQLVSAQSVYMFSYVDLVKKYRVLAGYHTPGMVYVSLYDDYHWAIPGGLNREALVYWNTISGGFWNHVNNKKRFLSWHPLSKKTSRTNHESLYFFSQYSDVTEYHVKILATKTSGATVTFELQHLHYSLQYFVLEIMVGYGQIAMESLAGGVVKSWKVWLENQSGTKISEERTFVIDDKYYEYPREFVFKNSFGVFDYYRFTGMQEKNLEYEREIISVDRAEAETYYNAPQRAVKILESQTFKASSGWLAKAELDYLREFMLSMEIYEIISERPWRCNITSKKTNKYLVDGEYLYSLEFEYERAYTDNFYSTI